ncbi:MAG TPA: CehA/McbA family metallohydrolase [Candidatus Acidoferrum sp.]|nr:CehA/McbA family metallohydrolase [Candidatus Acidoferrum sp.]
MKITLCGHGAQRCCAPTFLWAIFSLALAVGFAFVPGAIAQRKPVLKQIELPHPYYYREMYLPVLTSGPSSVTWSPDSREVIYSMGGALWRQNINSNTTQQITDGAGYDYQPDWSPDGKSVVYVSYQHDAMELWQLDLATGISRQITKGGAVNVEPRWSPDGKKIVFVSTEYHGRFHIFVMDAGDGFAVGGKASVVRLTEETKSTLPRYYYAEYDTEIHPTWSRDGKEILFVSNRGHIYGTGGFWRMQAEPGADAREIHYEETTWKARPDFSPDGTKILYSSYLGRQWHQLWVMPANGGDAFPISYGDWDETYARWSPDGKRIAFISNRGGTPEIWLQDFPGGGQRHLVTSELKHLKPRGRIEVTVTDPSGKPTPARVSVTDDAGKFFAPRYAWISGADGFDRAESEFEPHYFPSGGTAAIEVPIGKIHVEVMKGFEFEFQRRDVEVGAGGVVNVAVKLKAIGVRKEKSKPERSGDLASCGPGAQQCCARTTYGSRDDRGGQRNSGGGECWVSSDLHVHMNYGGEYWNSPEHLVLQAEAENLGIVNNLIVNKEQRIPDIAYAGHRVDAASNARAMVVHGQEFHTTQWGHLGLLNIRDGILLPGYAGYPGTAATSLLPMDADVADMAHARGALVGVAHPFDEDPAAVPHTQEDTPEELAADVALGKLDYLEVVGFNDYRATAGVWYRLLDLGFRIPAGAGTDAMANFASLRGPVGMDRVYARVPSGPVKIESFLDALKSGKTVATNGPLLDFSLGGEQIGGEVKLSGAKNVSFSASLRSIVALDHWELVCYGANSARGGGWPYFVQELKMGASRDGGEARGEVAIEKSGWCLVRASSDKSKYPILDNYVYGTTSPIYVTVDGKKPTSREDAEYFVKWMDRTTAMASKYAYWNSDAEKDVALRRLKAARAIYEGLR